MVELAELHTDYSALPGDLDGQGGLPMIEGIRELQLPTTSSELEVYESHIGTKDKFLPAEDLWSFMVTISRDEPLLKLLTKIKEIISKTEREKPELAMMLSNLEKSVTEIRDSFDRIIANTKTVMNYCSNHKVMPPIIKLIEEKRYDETEKELNGFIRCFKKLVRRVETDIETFKHASNGRGLSVCTFPSGSGLEAGGEVTVSIGMNYYGISNELNGKTTESLIIIDDVCYWLSRFSEWLNLLQSIIIRIKKIFDGLHDGAHFDGWSHNQETLQAVFEYFTHLKLKLDMDN